MKKIVLTSDSTCDLSRELIGRYDIRIIPFNVILGKDTFLDGVNVEPAQLYEFVAHSGMLPKTAAPGILAYKKFFEKILDGETEIIHFNIGSKLSAGHQNAKLAAAELEGVSVIDSASLSTGTSLLILKAHDLIEKGKTREEIEKIIRDIVPFDQASFCVDKLDYLHKGGRCSGTARFAANLLHLHPMLQLIDGEIKVVSKFRGNMSIVFNKYLEYLLEQCPNPDRTRCFVTHSDVDKEIVESAKRFAKEKFGFAEVFETVAGCTITSHCGKGTLGLLFLNTQPIG